MLDYEGRLVDKGFNLCQHSCVVTSNIKVVTISSLVISNSLILLRVITLLQLCYYFENHFEMKIFVWRLDDAIGKVNLENRYEG